jgi:hypothetical protein
MYTALTLHTGTACNALLDWTETEGRKCNPVQTADFPRKQANK